jgi:hypothetical protein
MMPYSPISLQAALEAEDDRAVDRGRGWTTGG